MLGFIKSGFTDKDGNLDDARIAAFILVLSYIVDSTMSVYMDGKHDFDPQKYGIGAGALAAGIGMWFGQRKDN